MLLPTPLPISCFMLKLSCITGWFRVLLCIIFVIFYTFSSCCCTNLCTDLHILWPNLLWFMILYLFCFLKIAFLLTLFFRISIIIWLFCFVILNLFLYEVLVDCFALTNSWVHVVPIYHIIGEPKDINH